MKEILQRNGIIINETQSEKLAAFRRILLEYNEKINLTAITDEEEISVKHFVDSIKGIEYLPEKGTIIDVGSGAGFPSIPLIIMSEGTERKFILLDSLKKRVDFLNYVIESLELKNAKAVHARAEEEGRIHRGAYDCAIARAVAPLNILLEYTLPLLKKSGVLIAYKAQAEEEIKNAERALRVLGGEIKGVDKYLLDNEFSRCFIIVEKIGTTPEKYPRGQNKPRISPL